MAEEKKGKYDPIKDNPAFARSNVLHRFGGPNANPRCAPQTATMQREFYRWVESVATEDELKAYVQDTSKPYTRRLYIQKLIKAKSIRDIHELTNQVHGLPTQVIEMAEPPKIEIVLTDGDEVGG